MSYPAPADIKGLQADPNLKVDEQAGLNVAYLAYNTLKAPFDKPEVRKALNQAINKKAIIDAVFQGQGQVAKTRSRRRCRATTKRSWTISTILKLQRRRLKLLA